MRETIHILILFHFSCRNVIFYFADNSELKKFAPSLTKKNIDLQSNLAILEDIEFEEKVDIDDLKNQ